MRYVGIDTPEVRRRVGEQWIVDPEPFARAATEANRKLVEGRAVRLEFDVQTHDRYGRTLAYVYVSAKGGFASGGDDIMVNEALLAAGYAQMMTIPPNVRYAQRFREAAKAARSARRGLWSGD